MKSKKQMNLLKQPKWVYGIVGIVLLLLLFNSNISLNLGSLFSTGATISSFGVGYDHPSTPASNAFDDDLNTYWSRSGSSSASDQAGLIIDLKNEYALTKVKLRLHNSWYLGSAIIDASVDGVTYFPIASLTQSQTQQYGTFWEFPVANLPARYVRLTETRGGLDTSMSADEFQVEFQPLPTPTPIGSVTPTPTPTPQPPVASGITPTQMFLGAIIVILLIAGYYYGQKKK